MDFTGQRLTCKTPGVQLSQSARSSQPIERLSARTFALVGSHSNYCQKLYQLTFPAFRAYIMAVLLYAGPTLCDWAAIPVQILDDEIN